MNIGVIIVLALVGLVGGVLSFGFALAAGADPEGRGGNYVFWGLIGAMLGAVCFIGFGTWALALWLTPL